MEDKLLYPAYPLMHVGLADDYEEYMLSGILATHGYVIRDINHCGGDMEVTCVSHSGKDSGRYRLVVHPSSLLEIDCPFIRHWHDLRLRYSKSEGVLSCPVWIQAMSFGGDSGVVVLDSFRNLFSEL